MTGIRGRDSVRTEGRPSARYIWHFLGRGSFSTRISRLSHVRRLPRRLACKRLYSGERSSPFTMAGRRVPSERPGRGL